MFRLWKASLVAVLALGTTLISAPPASAAVRVGFRGGIGIGVYGGGWYPGWGYGWYGPPYGPGYGYYGNPAGHVKISTPDKAASVFVDGGYIGPVAKAKKFPLRPGNHVVELRDPNGQIVYSEQVNVIRGRTVDIDTGAVQPGPAQPNHG
jgi:hypothetical protein